MPYGPPLYGIFWGHIFANIGGWGWSELFFIAGHGEICHPHGWSTWRPADQPTTRRSTWTWGLFEENHTRDPYGLACCGLVCGSPCGSHVGGKFRYGLLEKSLTTVDAEKNYHLPPNFYITAPYFGTIRFGCRNVKITSQKLSWNYLWAL